MERIKYDKENTITISKDTPLHLSTYLIGVMMGMGISFKLDPGCLLYHTLCMHQKKWYDNLIKQEGTRISHRDGSGATVYTSGEGVDDIKVNFS